VALAWRINEEGFLKNVDALSNLKLRLGWGVTGQQNIGQGDYPSIATYHTNQGGSYYQFGNNVIVPITPKGYAAQIKWEETTTYNIGLDFGFLKNRINGSVDVYKRTTKDLLNEVPVSAGTNLTNYLLMNVGDMENKGIEVAVNFVPIEQKDLRWEFGVNVAYNKNEITKLTANDDPSYLGVEAGDNISGAVGNKVQIQQVGHALNSFYVFQQVYDETGHPMQGVYVDRNGDGQISDDDRYVYYKPDADVNIGFNTELSYKKWTLSAALRSALGNYVYNNVASDAEMKADMWTNSFIANRVSTAPFTNFGNPAQYKSDYYVQNASWLKLDKVTLAYNICDWARVNFTVQNVFTITNYKGVDPEVGNGIDNNMYPRPRTFLVGASFNF
jgi:iron complex outermembrane receptor protein